MRTSRWRALGALALLATTAALLAGSASSATPADAVVSLEGNSLEAIDVTGGPVMLELEGTPSALAYAEARKLGASQADAARAGKARKAENEKAQENVVAALKSKGINATPLFDMQTAYNGIAVQAAPGTVADLAALPGVKAVHAIPLVSLDNHSSVPLIGATQAWSSFAKTGTGMSIAVIDTGVDYVHTGFGGSGSSADYAIALSAAANPPAATDDPGSFTITGSTGTQIYPSAKVVGGFDLAGDSYNADPASGAYQPVPNPDPNPMDCNGHGTHVAGTAAGTGVNANGTAFSGSYASLSDPSNMGIGPGVAPEAGIYALRVFGCGGSTALTAAAIEWATDPNRDGDPSDHVDVINMSLGSAYGTPDDPSAAASDNAAALGVIVVASAGNNTDITYVTGSPGSATRVISTASSVDAAERADAIVVSSPAAIAGTYIASKSVQPTLWAAKPETTGNVYYPATNQFGCSAWTGADAANIAGRIVLVDWKIGNNPFPCGSAVRANNATAAGAIGIIMADSTTFLDTAIAGNGTTPAMYTNVHVGNAFKSQLTPGAVNASVVAKLSSLVVGESVDEGRVDTISGFTSRGPRARDTGLKPDLAAPGQTIWSPDSRTGTRGRSLNGTSMAAPHVAGVMALLKQQRPTWSVEELKALAMNTAGHDLYSQFGKTGDKYGVARVGAGRVDVPAGLTSTSVAYNADGSGAVSVSFGMISTAKTVTRTKTIRVANKGAAAQTYTLSYDARTSIPGVSYSFPDGTSLSVPAGGSATFRVQVTVDPSVMQNTREATMAGAQGGNPRQWLSDASGLVLVTPSSGPTLRVPVYTAARPASATHASPRFLNVTPDGATLNLGGQGLNTGTEPLGYVSKTSAYELGIVSGKATLGTGVSELARAADVAYAGVTRKGANLYFGIASHAEWATPATDVQFTVQVDRNKDGTADWHVFNTRFTDTDVFVSAGQSLIPPSALAAFGFTNIFNSNVNTAPFNNDVLVLPVPVSSLALPAGQTSIKYRVVGFSRFWGTIDTTEWATYDVANPGLSFADGLGGTNMYATPAETSVAVAYNHAAYTANGSKGVLLLHHLNESGKRAEVLSIQRRGK